MNKRLLAVLAKIIAYFSFFIQNNLCAQLENKNNAYIYQNKNNAYIYLSLSANSGM